MAGLLETYSGLFWDLTVLALSLFVSITAHTLLFRFFKKLSNATEYAWDNILIQHIRGVTRFVFLLIALNIVVPMIVKSADAMVLLKRGFYLCWVLIIAYVLAQGIKIIESIILDRFDITERDNLQARKVYTQLQIFKRASYVVISILTFAFMLMTFEKSSTIGTSLLASAGVISIVIGVAAQRSLGNLLAGIQIALAQPIRIDDVVIVENEWGWVEEITLTYVVVRIWDLRRLVLPISYFIEKPFQNWTRTSADILGTVFIYTDYNVSVQTIREELYNILKNTSFWDGKVWSLLVTNTTERTVELRALMSAANASMIWNLRCHVREKLLEFIQKEHPQILPKFRAEFYQKEVE